MPFARAADGASIAYSAHDEGEPVLLVHGFASSAELNWERTGWFRRLAAEGFAPIALDLRGHGRSEKSVDPTRYTPEALVGDVLAVLDHRGLTRVPVIGYSMGAQLTRTLVTTSDRFTAAVLGGIGDLRAFATWDLEEVKDYLLRGTPMRNSTGMALLRFAMANPSAEPNALIACIEGFRTGAVPGPPGVPSLVVAGDRDDVAADAEVFAAEIGAGFHSLPGRNHINAVTARAFKDAVVAFLNLQRG